MYNNEVYHQHKGTAMGTRVAPSYANLLMGAFEKIHILSEHAYKPNITFYRRFIDGLFFIWQGTRDEALNFTRILNINDWGLKFTANFSDVNIKFLDLMVSVKDGGFSTTTFLKKVDTNSYLSYVSGH